MGIKNLGLYSTNVWEVLLISWLFLFVILWVFARNDMKMVLFTILLTIGIFSYLRGNQTTLDDLQELPVWSIIVIWVAVLIVCLTYLEKKEDVKNPDDRPATGSDWSMVQFRFGLLKKNSFLTTCLLLWVVGLILIVSVLSSMEEGQLSVIFGMPKDGHLPGWTFMIGVWWILFMFLNITPDAQWNQRNVFLYILIGLGIFGMWSAKMIPDGMKDPSKITQLKPIGYFAILFITLFSLLWIVFNQISF
jgi:hypothetical protein